ncbi:MAG: ribonuclease HI family protein [Candidatus Yanofskybacteria bacterium]|nr:ribonuclease HI family protein [Candidatus Yanofskybacteria bacterium]
MGNHYIIYTDGGSRGNPGPSALGAVIEGPDIGKKEYGEYIGETTNNIAEYKAMVFALKKLKQLIGADRAGESTVELRADSELLVKQLSGEYKVKEENMQDLFMEVWNLRLDFKKVDFVHIMREQNKEADHMVNYALDREENKLL